jgi:nitroreductase
MNSLMLNDRTSTLSLLQTRRSGRPREMIAPGPSSEQLDEILKIAARVPDHGKLAPWRFVIVDKDQREEFGLLLRRALQAEDECAGPAHHEKADQFARQGEALIVLISAPVAEHKIPVWEQELSAGAAAMNLLTAAHAMGYVGGKPGERIAGFIFIGSRGRELEERPRPEMAKISSHWAPPSD